jgi:hypothetical protein
MKADELQAQLECAQKGECAVVSTSDLAAMQAMMDALLGMKEKSGLPAASVADVELTDGKELDGYHLLLRLASRLSAEVRRQSRERKSLEHQLATAGPASMRKALSTPGKPAMDMQQWKELQRMTDENASLKREVRLALHAMLLCTSFQIGTTHGGAVGIVESGG